MVLPSPVRRDVACNVPTHGVRPLLGGPVVRRSRAPYLWRGFILTGRWSSRSLLDWESSFGMFTAICRVPSSASSPARQDTRLNDRYPVLRWNICW